MKILFFWNKINQFKISIKKLILIKSQPKIKLMKTILIKNDNK